VREIRGAHALVTGAAKRLGRAVALALAQEGANVVIHYRRSAEEAERLADELRRIGVRAWTLSADLRDPDELEHVIDRAGVKLDILVNNASSFSRSTFESVTRDELVAAVETEAWAPFALARRFASRAGGERGHVVNLLDTRVAGSFDWEHVAYLAAKDLLGQLTRIMAMRLAPGTSVNAVAPGLVLPPEGKGRDYLETLGSALPLRRYGDPAFVAEAVVFLVKSEFVTGQTIFVDGGRHLLGGSGG
jgi:NAD(P)-dependent dehydrogenase (short-subunit alcohol dehydrogenase family)